MFAHLNFDKSFSALYIGCGNSRLSYYFGSEIVIETRVTAIYYLFLSYLKLPPRFHVFLRSMSSNFSFCSLQIAESVFWPNTAIHHFTYLLSLCHNMIYSCLELVFQKLMETVTAISVSFVQAQLGSPKACSRLENLKPEPKPSKSPSWSKPWARAMAWST